ncbi:hypothetical protein CPAV1605_1397 [seawater metagenome]|uniref:Aspartyl/asparaginy/proline hydroxylase domain-containing protein n=1 Tax=seawater metagenome TaxID=1561972 RepID=A0A5E8CL84_9ZZZZ
MISLKLLILILLCCLFIRYKTKDVRKKSKSYNVFYSTDIFPILKYFENSWYQIFNEANNISSHHYAIPNFDRVNEKIIDYVIMENDYLMGRNSQLCPVTSSLLSQFKGVLLAKFVILKPFSISSIQKTSFNQKTLISYCLGISIPQDSLVKLYSSHNAMNIIANRSFIYDSSYPFYIENQSNYEDAIIFCVDIIKS